MPIPRMLGEFNNNTFSHVKKNASRTFLLLGIFVNINVNDLHPACKNYKAYVEFCKSHAVRPFWIMMITGARIVPKQLRENFF